MNLITLTTDFGTNSLYLATSKAALLSIHKDVQILDLTHRIEPCDITEAAFVVRNFVSMFPAGSIHIVAVDSEDRASNPNLIAISVQNQWILSYNTGLLHMISPESINNIYVGPEYSGRHFTSISNAFGPFCRDLIKGVTKKSGETQIVQKTMLSPAINEDNISGKVMYFDDRGFAYTNIHKEVMDDFLKGKSPVIRLTRFETVNIIKPHLSDSQPGSVGAFYNESGYLSIGIYHDDTRPMLGFKKGHVIMVEKK